MKKPKRVPSCAEKLLPQIVGGKLSEMATYSDLFENTPDAIFLLDCETLGVLDHNPAARKALGLTADEIDGHELGQWVDAETKAALGKNLRHLQVERKTVAPFDCVLHAAHHARLTFEISACRLKIADYCQVIQVIAKDVTEARASAAALVRANAELDQLSRTDAMTGLFNFRSLKARIAEEHERARRYGKPYAVILCDIDHFKNYNDQNGHPEGDKALQKAAAVLKARARTTDFVARYGGEEFVVLCPEVSAAQAEKLAEALRQGVEREEFAHGAKQPLGRLTISLGVAGFPKSGTTAEQVLEAADAALYKSKEGGRNRVTVATAPVASKKAA